MAPRNEYQNKPALDKFREQVDSLQAFHTAASSFAGRAGNRSGFMITEDRVARAIIALGRLALHRRLVGVALAVIRGMNAHAASRDWQAGMFRDAALALGTGYTDVAAATGPEACRWSDAQSPYTLGEKLLILETIRSLCDDWIGVGWAAEDLAIEHNVAHLMPTRSRS